MKKQAGHTGWARLFEGKSRAVLARGGGVEVALRWVLCGVRVPKLIRSPGPAQESRTLTSGAPSSQAGLAPVLLASNQQSPRASPLTP